uniref:F-box domain-containing protein n=1 Tax=Triticum urartu TaxID=4572 RepID=A0A8R7R8K7_TRIUA
MPPKVTIAASNDAVLPEDMLRHILVRLPAKTLCLFRAVCPSWRSLLSDPLFVAAHKSHHPEPLIVACNCEMFERGTINIMDLSGHVVKRIATTMKNARMVRTRRLDLICVTGHKGCHVINPATGDTFALPSCRAKEHAHVQHFFPESFDLGQVVTTGEYKALRCVSIDNFDHESSPMPVRSSPLMMVAMQDGGANRALRPLSQVTVTEVLLSKESFISCWIFYTNVLRFLGSVSNQVAWLCSTLRQRSGWGLSKDQSQCAALLRTAMAGAVTLVYTWSYHW